jgi:RNA polymerase sigma-70 factor, ECF subfamily
VKMGPEELALKIGGCLNRADDASEAEESAQTLKRAIVGDRCAFEQVMRQHEHRVLATARRLLGRMEDAQDAAQEVFLRLFKYLGRLDAERDLLPWLYRTTVNVCRDFYRKRSRQAELDAAEAHRGPAFAYPAVDVERSDQKRVIEQALATLAEKERAAIVLRDIEGLSTREVAHILGSSEATVRSQVSMARVKIRKFVDRFEKRQP